MDWAFTEEQEQLAGLVRQILEREVTEERRRAIDATEDRYDHALYVTLRDAGVFDPSLGLIGLCRVLVEIGRAVAPIPARHTLPAGIVTGRTDAIVVPAIVEEAGSDAASDAGPTTRADGTILTGTKTTVPAAAYADAFLVSASSADGVRLYLVDRQAPGVSWERQVVTSTEIEGVLMLQDATGEPVDGDVEHLRRLLTVAICAHQLGVCERALELTAEYAKQRVQFDRPIATFQAVGQRLADAYIDVQAIRLTLWQAAWRLAEGLDADQEIATAKFWAADAGHRVAHTAVHVHGGMGIDLDYHLHRYFTAAKRNEFALGGATEQLVKVGRALATEPA